MNIQKRFSLKNFPWTPRMQFFQPRRIFLLKCRKILTHSPNRSMILLFYKKLCNRRCSSGCKKCSFYKPAEKLLLKRRKFFTQNPAKQWADRFFRKSIQPHCSSGIVKSSFDNSAEKFRQAFDDFLLVFQQKCSLHLFWKGVHQKWSSAQLQSNFHFLAKITLLSGQKAFTQCPKTIKIRTFPSPHFSSKLIPRTVRMHVFNTPMAVFSEKPERY